MMTKFLYQVVHKGIDYLGNDLQCHCWGNNRDEESLWRDNVPLETMNLSSVANGEDSLQLKRYWICYNIFMQIILCYVLVNLCDVFWFNVIMWSIVGKWSIILIMLIEEKLKEVLHKMESLINFKWQFRLEMYWCSEKVQAYLLPFSDIVIRSLLVGSCSRLLLGIKLGDTAMQSNTLISQTEATVWKTLF